MCQHLVLKYTWQSVDFIVTRCVSEGLLKAWPLLSLADVSGCENPIQSMANYAAQCVPVTMLVTVSAALEVS